MFAIRAFTEAISAGQLERAVELASSMTANLKDVAREIWTRWVPAPVPF